MERSVVAETAGIDDASLLADWVVEGAPPECANCCVCCAPTHVLHWLAFEDATRSHVRHGIEHIIWNPQVHPDWPAKAHAHEHKQAAYVHEEWIRARDMEVDRAYHNMETREWARSATKMDPKPTGKNTTYYFQCAPALLC